MTLTTPQPTSVALVREQAASIGHGDAIVQGRNQAVDGDKYKSFQIRLKKLVPAEQATADDRAGEPARARQARA